MRTKLLGCIQIVSHRRNSVKRKSFSPGYYFAAAAGDFSPVQITDLCYTMFALNASVVLCGPSGLDLLRLPALRFLRSFLA
jgi:hypothetical protein